MKSTQTRSLKNNQKHIFIGNVYKYSALKVCNLKDELRKVILEFINRTIEMRDSLLIKMLNQQFERSVMRKWCWEAFPRRKEAARDFQRERKIILHKLTHNSFIFLIIESIRR